MTQSPSRSPYLKGATRLADVLTAIQVLATYKFYKLSAESWSDRIRTRPLSADRWSDVFREHPEFFRFFASEKKGEERVSLAWRRAYPKRFHVDTEETLTRDDYQKLTKDEKKRVSRRPLDHQIATLMSSAIELHRQALAQQQERRWWIPVVTALGGALIGALSANLGDLIGLLQ